MKSTRSDGDSFGYNLVLLTLFLSLRKNNGCFVCLLKYSVIKPRAC